jgi:uncharacterized protein YjiS (DUF1127 family)
MFMPTVRAAYHAFQENRARRNTAHMLASLNDATLKDLGIHRTQITSVVAHMPYRGGKVQG